MPFTTFNNSRTFTWNFLLLSLLVVIFILVFFYHTEFSRAQLYQSPVLNISVLSVTSHKQVFSLLLKPYHWRVKSIEICSSNIKMRSCAPRKIIEEEFVSGVIQFFNKERGFGFINRIGDCSKDYFFHFSEIEGMYQ